MPHDGASAERVQVSAVLPFRQRATFFSAAEAGLFRALCQAAGPRFVVLAKVALNDLFFVARPNENVHYFNRLFRKSIDFLLCDSDSLKPAIGIQLVRAGAGGVVRGADKFVQDLFAAAQLPLLPVPPAEAYDIVELQAAVVSAMDVPQELPEPSTRRSRADAIPMCPVCGKMMVLRIQRSGRLKGRLYYGCIDNPTCPSRVAA